MEGDNTKVSNLLDRMDVSAVNERQTLMPLNTACRHNNGALTLLLAKPGIDVNDQDTNGFTPLHFACLEDSDQAAIHLLATPGIDVNDNCGTTPLHFACCKDNDQIVARLLATPGIDVNVKNNYGVTPVTLAANLHNEESFKLLLHDHRVHLDVKEKEGRGLEEIIDLSGSSVENQKYLNLIREERMKREHVCKKKDDESTHIVIDKIEKINKKIKDNEKRWTKVVEKLDLECEKLARKHQEEKTQQELGRKKLARKHQEEKTQQEWEREKLEKGHQEEKTKQEKRFAREAEGNKQHITNLTDVRNDLAQDLEKIHFNKGRNDASNNNADHKLEAARGYLECPICLESMEPPKKIWMCIHTHAICEACKIFLNGKPCPTCESESVNLRAYMIEKIAGIVFSKSEG